MVDSIPMIDVSSLLEGENLNPNEKLIANLDNACREVGFFLVQGHGISFEDLQQLRDMSAQFFALPQADKADVAMSKGGKAWRGWFPLGGELTSGKKDGKEGYYFGSEGSSDDDPRPLHGRNLFPKHDDDKEVNLKGAVLKYMEKATKLARVLLRGISAALGLPITTFEDTITRDPTVLFRIFHYPPSDEYEFGVGEHCDYGLLTILAIDHIPGLQVRPRSHDDSVQQAWIDVPVPEPGAFSIVVNLGDMLEKLTLGRYRSTPHRVKNMKGISSPRFSFPLFFDPSWDAYVTSLPLPQTHEVRGIQRWDHTNIHAWEGQYGTYLTKKVSRCFPELFGQTIDDA